MRKEKYPGIPRGLSRRQESLKRTLDLCVAVPCFIVSFPLVLLVLLIATIDTKEWGIFSQSRIGLAGKPFRLHKVRSMRTSSTRTTTVTVRGDPRITRFGSIIRKSKLDELPQLWNVILGEMSLVGPRPDMAGWADALEGQDRVILSVRPGVTGPASVVFKAEEEILAQQEDPDEYNSEVLWPEKVKLNVKYIENWSVVTDIRLMVETVFGVRAG